MFQRLIEGRLLIVIRGLDTGRSIDLCGLLYDSGVFFAEVSFSDRWADESLKELKKHFGDKLLLGAGTIFNADDYSRALRAGADYILSPGFSHEVAALSLKDGIPYIPGVYTSTEIQMALNMGFTILKLFPGELEGLRLLKAYRGPFPQARFMPFGGVTPENAAAFIEEGAAALGVGSYIASPELLQERKYGEISERISRMKIAAGIIDD
ncbi:MAG TPA: bifunctional 4-hydroxy-2-oxoglutarate aldolase/2-dehydro-3-deoxy-phosphogluconate aldolase [Mesotoga sp.]|jgi:Entner-Doudoroff aldolase|nr:bifunctional 4-hydroxy-2-oxoglutarate aldolase/2-dehydro-3-deoxy-phosphogluconate aldolase [Mesotoga sp.]MDI9375663.1 bifunctional 4-hydroxy-2-oxoglutarate aldolase/2-dehydro-3-deoxy-phosphogluconate aldolase [Thermotogota bacterium]NLX35000.1 bifunctional 4-hydroxy-2-oxoglutarate aldolase/2-dehydro-3-deoxy-phosphogluconate aldolase [Thermotogaceae bacterium]MDD4039837.1 bifunctional 4-hydroxy-2-oxoglutarate aldolase/2-dehydro-3-deoxy-phosphogluconate aldolase [Mesotoga sp.]MDD4479503.1 bifu